jgi:serine/threonine protein kinase
VLNPEQILANRYRLIELVGLGTMGAVYTADDLVFVRRVALKQMQYAPDASERIIEQTRNQFEREAKILATLNHPNLPRVTDYFTLEGQQFLVMDYIEGQSLDQILAAHGGGLDEATVLDWADQLLSALEYIHRHGLVHRDVKPANIRVTPNGHVFLVDFGLVKAIDPDSPKTATAMRGLGTPQYAPPEQYDAELGHTEPRSDIYSLGATLYHLLAGIPPATVTRRVSNPKAFRPIREIAPAVSRDVERVIQRAMEVPIAKRFARAGDMRAALQVARARSTLDPGSTSPLPAQGLTRSRKWPRRRILGVGSGLAVMLGIVITAAVMAGPDLLFTPAPTGTSTEAPAVLSSKSTTQPPSTATPTLTRVVSTTTATATSSATATATATNTLTPTSSPSPTRTRVPVTILPTTVIAPTVNPSPTVTSKGGGGKPPTATSTPRKPTNTPIPQPTDTPIPQPTDTPTRRPTPGPTPTQ